MTDQELIDEIKRLRAAAGAGQDEVHSVQPLPREPGQPLDKEQAAAEASDMSTREAGAFGIRRVAQKIKNGGAQAFLTARDAISPNDPGIKGAFDMLESEERENKMRSDAVAKEHPFSYGAGEAALTLPLGGGILPSFLKGAAVGGLKYGNAQDRTVNALVEGGTVAGGNTVGSAAGGFLNPNLSPAQRNVLQAGRARGIYPRLSQVTRSPTTETLEDWAHVMPFGSGTMGAHAERNQAGFNRIAAESMGQRPDSAGMIGPEVFANAQRDMRAIFNEVDRLPNAREAVTPTPAGPPRVYDGIPRPRPTGVTPGGAPPIVVSQDVATAAMEALRQQSMQLTPDATLTQIAEEALHAAQNGGRMTGEAYQKLHHELTNASFKAFNASDPASGRAFAALRDAIDESADASLRQMGRGDLADQLATVRQQYANFKTLTTGRVSEGGDVHPPRVANAMRTNNPDGFRTGATTGQSMDFMANWAELFPTLNRGSQTAPRVEAGKAIRNPSSLETAVGAIASPIIAKATTSPIVTGLPARMGGTSVGKAVETLVEPSLSGTIQSYIRRLTRPVTP